MRAVVVYESMYGNTHEVAEAIGEGLRSRADTEVVVTPVAHADAPLIRAADLVVVGGPTHAHGMSRPATRKAAVEAAHKPEHELPVEPDAQGPGVRDWVQTAPMPPLAAAFDTRIHLRPLLSGRASKGIARKLRHRGTRMIAGPESFFVTKENHLEPGERERAREWAAHLPH